MEITDDQIDKITKGLGEKPEIKLKTINLRGAAVISSHFTPFLKAKNITLYVSDGTSPSGNLKGQKGDVCFGADSGKAYKCTTSNSTTWLAF